MRSLRDVRLTLFLLGTAVLVGACQSQAPDIGVSLSEVADSPEAHYGDIVTVSGEVDDVIGPRAFTIGGDDFDDDLLILSIDSIPVVSGRVEAEPVWEDDIVQVTGTVVPYVEQEIEAEFDTELDAEIEAEYEERGPAVITGSEAAGLPPIVVTPRRTAPPTDTAGAAVDTL